MSRDLGQNTNSLQQQSCCLGGTSGSSGSTGGSGTAGRRARRSPDARELRTRIASRAQHGSVEGSGASLDVVHYFWSAEPQAQGRCRACVEHAKQLRGAAHTRNLGDIFGGTGGRESIFGSIDEGIGRIDRISGALAQSVWRVACEEGALTGMHA